MNKAALRVLQISAFAIPIAAIAVYAGVYANRMYNGTVITRELKLADCTNQTLNASFLVPDADRFQIVLGGGVRFDGVISVKQSPDSRQNFRFSDSTAITCNWLDRVGYPDAKILTWNADPPLELTPGQLADVAVTFETIPPTNASVWISFAQTYGSFKKERATPLGNNITNKN